MSIHSLQTIHRVTFNKKIFGHKDGNDQTRNTSKSSSKAFSRVEYEKRLHVFDSDNWGVGDLTTMLDDDRKKYRAFRQEFRREGSNWIGKIEVKPVTLARGTTVKRLFRVEQSDSR